MSDAYDRLQGIIGPNGSLKFSSNYGITLVPYLPAVYVEGRTTGYRLFVSVDNARGIDRHIFVYQRKPIIYGLDNYKDDFSGVASPADLEEYAVGSPSDPAKPFFRLDTFDCVFRSLDTLIETLESLGSDVNELVRTKASFDTLQMIGVIPIGTPADESSSSSSS